MRSQEEIKKDWCDKASMALAAYYQFHPELDGNVHPRVLEVVDFLYKNMNSPEDIKRFVTKIKQNCQFFPKYTEMSYLFQGFKTARQTNLVDTDYGKFAEKTGVTIEAPEETKDATIQEILKDHEEMALRLSGDDLAKALFKKYGVKKCGQAFMFQGANWSDEEYERFNFMRRQRILR